MKYYDVKGNEISYYKFNKNVKEIKKRNKNATIIFSFGKTGTGENYKQLTKTLTIKNERL